MSRKNYSDFIKSDIKNKILDEKLDVKLTLGDLSKHYDVSTRPVRQAIEMLIAEKVIFKGSNGRLTPNEKINRNKIKKDEVKKPIDYFQKVSEELIKLSLKGEDRLVREHEMIEQYDVSQTVIRQVFSKLHGHGILEHIPRRGWHIKPFRKKALIDFCEAREVLELKAMELAKDHLEKEQLQNFYELNYYDRKEKKYYTDDRFHQYMIQKANNQYIIDFFAQHSPYFTMLFTWELKQPNRFKDTCNQHRAILKNMIDKNWKEAKKELSNHILNNHYDLFAIK